MKKSKLHYLKSYYPYILIMIFTIIILYPQIKSGAFTSGRDTWFHMNQFYDTAMQIKTGHFSYFLSMFGFAGIGRIVNAIYGPGFDYVNGLILLAAGTWYHFELIQNFIFLILSGFLFYLLMLKNKVAPLIGTLLSLLYMITQPIMSLVIGQEFNGLGGVLLPLIILQGTRMVRDERIYPVSLAVVMAITFQTHMLTTLIGSLALIPFFIYTWRITADKKALWMHLLMSIGLTLLLTGNVWGAMLNVFPQKLIPPVPQGMPTNGGALAFLADHHAFSLLGLSFSVMMSFFIVCGIISLFLWNKSTTLYKIILFIGLFFMWASTVYFPWRIVLDIYPAFKYQIQYPKRFLCAGIILVLLAMGMLFTKLFLVSPIRYQKVLKVIVPIILLIFVGMGYRYQHSQILSAVKTYRSKTVIGYNPFHTYHPTMKKARQLRKAYHSPRSFNRAINLEHQDTPDYLPTYRSIHTHSQYRHTAIYSGVERQYFGDLRYLHVHRMYIGDRLVMAWDQRHSKRNVIVPIVKYRDSQISFDHHVLYAPEISRMGGVKLHRISRGKRVVSVKYQTPGWFVALMYITLISWLIVIGQAIYKSYRRVRSL